MEQKLMLQWLAVGASYLGLLILIIRTGIQSVKRSTIIGLELTQIRKDMVNKDELHDKEISAIKLSVSEMDKKNSDEHGKLFKEISEIGKGVARIEGKLSNRNE